MPSSSPCSQAQGKVALTQFLGKPYSCINGSRKCPEFYFQTRKKNEDDGDSKRN